MSNKHLQSNSSAANGSLAKSKNSALLNGTTSVPRKSNKDKERERAERESLVLWLHPVTTLKYCGNEAVILLQTYGKQ